MTATDPILERHRSARARAVGSWFLRFRPIAVTPAAIFAITVLLRDPAVSFAQRRAAVIGFIVALFFFWGEAIALRVRAITERWLVVSLSLTLLGLFAANTMLGGLRSPALPLLFAPTVTAFAAFGRSRYSVGFLLFFCVGVLLWYFDAVQPPFAPFASATQQALSFVFLLAAVVLLWASVAGLTEAHAQASATLDRMRDAILREAQERTQTLDAMGAKVAHELRNPLTSIKGLVRLLAKDAVEDRAKKRFSVVDSEVERLEKILEDYLSFARPIQALRIEPIALDALVNNVLALLEVRIAVAQLQVVVDGAPITLRVDAHRMEAALLNVFTNAIEATPAHGTILCRWHREGPQLVLIVKDSGKGMSPETLAQLGTPYASGREDGHGLGVLLFRSTIEQHGGSVQYESALQQGTTVTIRLPIESP